MPQPPGLIRRGRNDWRGVRGKVNAVKSAKSAVNAVNFSVLGWVGQNRGVLAQSFHARALASAGQQTAQQPVEGGRPERRLQPPDPKGPGSGSLGACSQCLPKALFLQLPVPTMTVGLRGFGHVWIGRYREREGGLRGGKRHWSSHASDRRGGGRRHGPRSIAD